MTISGKLIFSDPQSITDACEIQVVVEDTNRADASAIPVAEQRVSVTPADLESGVSFSFSEEMPRPGLSVRAHLSRNGTSDIDLGDHISMQSHPAKEAGVEVFLREVK